MCSKQVAVHASAISGSRGWHQARTRHAVTRVIVLVVAVLSAVVSLAASTDTAATSTEGGDLAHCSNPQEAYYMADGRDYAGFVNVTVSGIPCARWTAPPSGPNAIDVPVGTGGVGDHNYCRNPTRLARPWCLTTDPDIPFQFCDVGDPCPIVADNPTVSSSPVSGTHFTSRADAVVSLSCFPKPCDIYYTLDGTEPAPVDGTHYDNSPFQLQGNTTVKYVGVFAGGTQQYRVAFYTIPPVPKPSVSVYFTPTTALSYKSPVLVIVGGLSSSDSAVYYVNTTFMGRYTEPFWLSSSSEVMVVVNGRDRFSATYDIQVTPPALALYPPSGSYIGGTDVLVYPTSLEPATFYLRLSVNGSEGEWTRIEDTLVTLRETGVTKVHVKAIYLGGVVSYVDGVYVIAAATAPAFAPSPLGTHVRPVRAVCRDPTGRLLPLDGSGLRGGTRLTSESESEAGESPDEVVYGVRFSSPGVYELNCSYTDDAREHHDANATFVLAAQSLPAPRYDPLCEDSFPRIPITLSAQLLPPSDNSAYYNGSMTRLSLSASLVEGGDSAALDSVTRVDADTYTYRLVPTTAASGGSSSITPYVRVRLTATSTDPMEASSESSGCRYHFLPLGTASTAVVAARPLESASPACRVDRDGELGAACAAVIAAQLARCLRFNTTELISASTVGPFVLLSVTGLDSSLLELYEAKVMACLQDSSLVAVQDAVSESSGAVAVATGWRVAFWAGGSQLADDAAKVTVPAGLLFFVQVTGYHVMRATDYRFVREHYSCEDIGYPALVSSVSGRSSLLRGPAAGGRALRTAHEQVSRAALSRMAEAELSSTTAAAASSAARQSNTGSDTSTLLPFFIDSPGRYKLCARIGSAIYVVPSYHTGVEPILETSVWPVGNITTGSGVDSCGGLVSLAHTETPISITLFTKPQWLYVLFAYSLDAASEWTFGVSGIAITLPKRVNPYTNTAEVISASLGPLSGVPAAVCAYYAPALSPPVNTTGLTYSFHTVGNRTITTTTTPEYPASHDSVDSLDGGSSSNASGAVLNETTPTKKWVSGIADVVVTLHGTFQLGERVEVQLLAETERNSSSTSSSDGGTPPLQLVASLLATPSVSASSDTQFVLATPDSTILLPFSQDTSLLHVRAVLDGSSPVVVNPTVAALSPLSLAMFPCNTCRSGYCYSDFACVCIGAQNKTAYMCSEVPTPPEPVLPSTPMSERLLLLVIYFGLLTAIGVTFLLAIRRGAARSKRILQEEHEEGEEGARSADPAVREGPPDGPTRRHRSGGGGGRAVDVTVVGDDEGAAPPAASSAAGKGRRGDDGDEESVTVP